MITSCSHHRAGAWSGRRSSRYSQGPRQQCRQRNKAWRRDEDYARGYEGRWRQPRDQYSWTAADTAAVMEDTMKTVADALKLASDFGTGFARTSAEVEAEVNNASQGVNRLAVDFEEQAEHYKVTADVPGLQRSDLKVTVDLGKHTLKIAGEREQSRSESFDQAKFKATTERIFGKFARELHDLPEDADLKNVSARVERGVLHVLIKKKTTVQDDNVVHVEIN